MHKFYRIKLTYKGEANDGAIVTVKSETLVMAVNYTDAETIAVELMKGHDSFGEVTYEIVQTKIEDVLYNEVFETDGNLVCGLIEYFFSESEDTETGLYAVTAIGAYYDNHDKEKNERHTFYVPATSPSNAVKFVTKFISDKYTQWHNFTIRSVKYDNASSVMVTPEIHQMNVR